MGKDTEVYLTSGLSNHPPLPQFTIFLVWDMNNFLSLNDRYLHEGSGCVVYRSEITQSGYPPFNHVPDTILNRRNISNLGLAEKTRSKIIWSKRPHLKNSTLIREKGCSYTLCYSYGEKKYNKLFFVRLREYLKKHFWNLYFSL